MKFLIACLLASCYAISLLAQKAETPTLSELLIAKARIVQLESQLAKVNADAAVCQARAALSTQQQQESATKAAMQAIEKDAGCKLNWAVTPVVCQDGQ